MKTKIYSSFAEFVNREDYNENGVSAEFAAEHPDWEAENESNNACWNCSGCRHCYDCYRCYCSDCYDCYGVKNEKTPDAVAGIGAVPVIEGIHGKILEAVTAPKALDMTNWHKCDTTHCRAGWAVHLAGSAGYELEDLTSTLFAAMLIFKASSPIHVPPARFFDGNEAAMDDIRRCAEEEGKALKVK